MERLTKSNKRKRARKHGFLLRSKTHSGRSVLKRRIKKKRTRLAV